MASTHTTFPIVTEFSYPHIKISKKKKKLTKTKLLLFGSKKKKRDKKRKEWASSLRDFLLKTSSSFFSTLIFVSINSLCHSLSTSLRSTSLCSIFYNFAMIYSYIQKPYRKSVKVLMLFPFFRVSVSTSCFSISVRYFITPRNVFPVVLSNIHFNGFATRRVAVRPRDTEHLFFSNPSAKHAKLYRRTTPQ